MNLKKNGTPSPLQMYKESTEKKNKHSKKKMLIQFLVIFVLSHTARTLTSEVPPEINQTGPNAPHKDRTLLQLRVDSMIALDEKSANLMNLNSKREIEGIEVINKEVSEDGNIHALLSIPNQQSRWVINDPKGWKLIPPRKVNTEKRKSYEIIF